MSGEEGAAYVVQILDASFKLCLQKPNAGVLMAHGKLLANGTAMYPYVSTPSTSLPCLKESTATARATCSRETSPRNWLWDSSAAKPSVETIRSRRSISNRSTVIFWPCTSTGNRTQPNRYNRTSPEKTTWKPTGGGYAIYVLNVDDDVGFNTKRRGDCRLEIRFGTALPKSVTVLMYGKFPRIVHVDQSRSVLLQCTIWNWKDDWKTARQSELCGRIAHLDREETQNVRLQHQSVFAAWIALDRLPFPSTQTSGIFRLKGWASENLQLTLRIRPSQQRTGISLHARPNSTGRQRYLQSILHSFHSRAISTPFFPRRLERRQQRNVGGKR